MIIEENKIYTAEELVDLYQDELNKGNIEDMFDFMKKFDLKIIIGKDKSGFIKKGKEN